MMHDGQHDGCRCVCVTHIGLFIRYKSNINIALVTARLPLHWSPSVCQCENHRRREEPEPEPIPHYEWPVLGLGPPLALDISNKTRIQIKWAEIWCNYLNAPLRHKTKEKFFIAPLSEMRAGTRKFSPLPLSVFCLQFVFVTIIEKVCPEFQFQHLIIIHD